MRQTPHHQGFEHEERQKKKNDSNHQELTVHQNMPFDSIVSIHTGWTRSTNSAPTLITDLSECSGHLKTRSNKYKLPDNYRFNCPQKRTACQRKHLCWPESCPLHVPLRVVVTEVGARRRNVCSRHIQSCQKTDQNRRRRQSIEFAASLLQTQPFKSQEKCTPQQLKRNPRYNSHTESVTTMQSERFYRSKLPTKSTIEASKYHSLDALEAIQRDPLKAVNAINRTS